MMQTRKTQYLLMLLATVLVGNLMILAAYWKSRWLPPPDQATVPQLHRWLVNTDLSAKPEKFRQQFLQRIEYEMDRPCDQIQPLDLLADGEQSTVRANLKCLVSTCLQKQQEHHAELASHDGDDVFRRSWRWTLKWLVYRTQLLGPNLERFHESSSEDLSGPSGELTPGLQEFFDQVLWYGLNQERLADLIDLDQPCKTAILEHLLAQTVEVLSKDRGENRLSQNGNLKSNLETLLQAWCRRNAAEIHRPLSASDRNTLSAQLPGLITLLVHLRVQTQGEPREELAETWARVFEAANDWTPDEATLIQFMRLQLEDQTPHRNLGQYRKENRWQQS